MTDAYAEALAAAVKGCTHEPEGTTTMPGWCELCHDCKNALRIEWRRIRKAQLAAMPRCCACKRRAAWRVSGVGLCGHHLRQVEGRVQGAGLLGTVILSPDQVVLLATV
jgi:hypothetical protein